MAKRAENGLNAVGIADLPLGADRKIYGAKIPERETDPQAANPGYAVRQPKKSAVKRKHATSSIVGVIFSVAIAALLYTHNVIMVKQLAKEINDLNMKLNSTLSTNEVLKAEINRKSSLDRISMLAQEKLGMVNPKEAPVWFEIRTQ